MFLKKMFAFIKKDFLVAKSYKLMFILNWGGIVTSTRTFYFISKLFGDRLHPYIAEYGAEYFPFVIIGIAFSTYLFTALNSISSVTEDLYSWNCLKTSCQSKIKSYFSWF